MLFKKPSPNPPRERNPRPNPKGPVFSYYANRSVREGNIAREVNRSEHAASPRPLSLQKKVWFRRLSSFAIVTVILVVSVLSLRLDKAAKIIPIGAHKEQLFLQHTSVYTAAVGKAFSKPLNGNKLTVNTNQIADGLLREFPELKAVSIVLPIFGTQPKVYLQPTLPELLLSSERGLFLLDSNGRALMRGNQISKLNEAGMQVVTDKSNLLIEVGQIALPRSTMAFIRELSGQLQAKGLVANSIILPQGTDELHLRLQGAGYYVKFNLHSKARERVGAFFAAKAHLEAGGKTPHEYVDVRVENKVYYK